MRRALGDKFLNGRRFRRTTKYPKSAHRYEANAGKIQCGKKNCEKKSAVFLKKRYRKEGRRILTKTNEKVKTKRKIQKMI